jgi:hypothetical protein
MALALLIMGYGYESEGSHERTDWTAIGSNILNIAGVFFLLKNGSFYQSKQFRLIFLGFAITILGALFKIMHWPFSSPLLIIGMLFIPTIYLIHFYHKSIKEFLDYLKLVWVFSFYILSLSILLHWYRDDYKLGLINEMLFFLILVFVFNQKRNEPEWINN